MKKIEDYPHLYLGCQVEFGFEGRKKKGYLTGKHYAFGWEVFDPSNAIVPYKNVRPDLIKLILRPLSDITEEERKECDIEAGKPVVEGTPHPHITQWARRIDWLLKKHFDLFGLIEEGLAIDKTTLK